MPFRFASYIPSRSSDVPLVCRVLSVVPDQKLRCAPHVPGAITWPLTRSSDVSSMCQVLSLVSDHVHTLSAEKRVYAFHTGALRMLCGNGGPECQCAASASLGKRASPFRSTVSMAKCMADLSLGHPIEMGVLISMRCPFCW